jgi:hypothetical protein
MNIKQNNEHFFSLRKQYPVFSYDSYDYHQEGKDLILSFRFSIGSYFTFTPQSRIKYHPDFDKFFANNFLYYLDDFVFSIGMIELISYWKCCCSPIIEIKAGNLSEDAILFWKKIYYHGLGEFFYCNSIETNKEEFAQIIPNQQKKKNTKPFFSLKEETIVPVGGGKDSVVTLEMLRKHEKVTPMIINPRGATLDTVKIGGFENKFFEIQRNIDPLLIELNEQGFLNGHTPFSAMLAFYSLLTGVLSGKKNIALSNESSANESTVIGMDVNHQYSKSYEFEADFRNYVQKYLSEELNYYSFLRPLSELQIACLFSKNPQYLPVFKSCNAGSKTNSWCCNCAKCLFTFIILSPFINPGKLKETYGKNLLEKGELLPVLKELCGLTPEKPFECVGTVDEVCIALVQTVKQYKDLPVLLHFFVESPLYEQYKKVDFTAQLEHLETEHFLPEKELKLLKQYLYD